MNTLPVAIILANRATADQTRSALPDAPVVPVQGSADRAVHRPRAARSRAVLAHQLERAARAVQPTPAR
jgi:hypothetical protein